MSSANGTPSGRLTHNPTFAAVVGALTVAILTFFLTILLYRTESLPESLAPIPTVTVTVAPTGSPTSPPGAGSTQVRLDSHSDLVHSTGDIRTDRTDLSINGADARWGFWGYCAGAFNCYPDDVTSMYVTLKGDYKTFSCIIGIEDESASTESRRVQILVDGDAVLDEEFAVGESQSVNLSVIDAVRLEILFYGEIQSVNPAIGEPFLTK